jgi:hypothetical protein
LAAIAFTSCKKDDHKTGGATSGNLTDTATLSIDIHGGLFFPDTAHADLYIDTVTYPRPARWYCFFATNHVETLRVGFIDTSWGRSIPIETFIYTGDSVSAWFEYTRINSTDTIENCGTIHGTFEITSSDSIGKEISANFEALLFDTASGETIDIEGSIGNFWYTVH